MQAFYVGSVDVGDREHLQSMQAVLGFGHWGLGLLGTRSWFLGLGLRFLGLGPWVSISGCWVLGFRVGGTGMS